MKDQLNSQASRRSFFAKTAVLFGAGGVATKLAVAQSPTTPAPALTDIDILNYALTLEHLEAAFYVQGVARFGASDFNNGSFIQIFGSKVASNVFTYLQAIRDHEVTHVSTLIAVIKQLGGTPVPPCTYNFNYNTPDEFIAVAMLLENTGVMAYDGAIALIKSPDLIQAGATIATVEARHAAYLNLLNGAIPFPSAFDQPKSMAEILAAAGQFITSCPVPPPTSPAANPNAPRISGLPTTVNASDREVGFDLTNSRSVNGMAVSFALAQVSGPNASIIAANTAGPRVQLLGGKGTYVFEETVTDLAGLVSKSRVTINYSGS